MNPTDIVVGLCCLYWIYEGIKKGLLHAILGPISLIIGTIIAIIYYNRSGHLFWAFLISIAAPFFLHLALRIILKIWNITINDKNPPSLPSGILGAGFNILWNGTVIALTLLFILMVPFKFQWVKNIQTAIRGSVSYSVIHFAAGNKMPLEVLDVKETVGILQDPKRLADIQKTKEYKNVMSNTAFQGVINDEETLRQIQRYDIKSLLENPKMKDLLSDKNLIKQLFELNKTFLKVRPQADSQ